MQIILILIGAGLLVGAYLSYQKTRKFIDTAVTTQGTIIEVVAQKSTSTDEDGYSSTTTNYYPVIEFKDQNGKLQKFQASVGVSNKRKWQVQSQLTILYDPQKPEKASIQSFMQLWFTTLLLAIFGLIFLPIGFLIKV